MGRNFIMPFVKEARWLLYVYHDLIFGKTLTPMNILCVGEVRFS